MYTDWPFFRSMIDSAQMILGKADLHVAERYAELTPDPAVAHEIFGAIKDDHEWQHLGYDATSVATPTDDR